MTMTRHAVIDGPIGREVHGYRLVQFLGSGGFASVFRAEDGGGRPVAVKILATHLARNQEFLRRFRQEGEMAQMLPPHPHIARTLAVGTHPDLGPYLVMEFLDGQDLAELLLTGSPTHRLELTTALRIGDEVADAVAHLHRFGIIHRDIKPSNIRITPTGLAKVMDFGIARPTWRRKSTVGLVMGTPEYMAPERKDISWPGGDDPRVDIYSLGVVLYEMLAGWVPFDGPDPSDPVRLREILRQQQSCRPKSLAALRSDLPAGLEAVILKALAPAPGARYASMPDLRADLARFIAPITPLPSDAYLVAANGQRLPLRPAVTTLGRHPLSDIPMVNDRQASIHHACIQHYGQGYLLWDVGSTNGTFHNGRLIRGSVVLNPGDWLQVGQTRLQFMRGSLPPTRTPSEAPIPTPTPTPRPPSNTDDALIEAVCHGSALLTLIALFQPALAFIPLLVPLVVWLLKRGDASSGVAAQAAQAAIYQTLVIVALLVLYLARSPELGVVVWLASTLYAGWAALRVLTNHAFQYPLLAGWVGSEPPART